ncbi:tRNA (adenosine(37)-N6)-threonylcarbamoyltransferase complex ATPase subunit type 1 TsaE [Acidobacteriota bacterium]
MNESFKEYLTRSEEDTIAVASSLARDFTGDELVLLTGELGAGKTIFAKGVCLGLGLEDISQVCSPSYTLVNIYTARVPVYHLDLYRLGDSTDISDLGWEDYLGEGVIIIEWGERMAENLDCIRVTIDSLSDTERKIRVFD